MTIRRTIVILILLAIVFFIYRGISPSGADRLLVNIKNIPVRLGLLSGELIPYAAEPTHSIVSSGTVDTGTALSGTFASTGQALVFSSTLASGGLFALEALVIPPQNTSIIQDTGDALFVDTESTGGSLIIVQTTGEVITSGLITKPIVAAKPKPTPHPVASSNPSSSRVSSQDIALLNNLFR